MSSDLNSLGDRNVPASNPRIWTRFALRKLRPSVGGRSWVRQTISLRAPGGHSRVTHSRNQADTRGHRRTRRRSNSSTGGTARTPTRHERTTPLRRFGTVRPRVQIPGPRPFRVQNRHSEGCVVVARQSEPRKAQPTPSRDTPSRMATIHGYTRASNRTALARAHPRVATKACPSFSSE